MSVAREPVPNIREPVTNSQGLVYSRWYTYFLSLFPTPTYSGTITTAKLTTGGANGSLTFVNGVLVSQTAAT